MNIYFCFLAGDNSKQEDPCIKRRKKRQTPEKFQSAKPPNQAITHRNFNYASALAAVQDEEYLDDVDFDPCIRRRKRNISVKTLKKPDEGKVYFQKDFIGTEGEMK